MTKLERWMDNVDIRDIDRQAECQKGNYLVGNDQEWYRFAVHNIVDETDKLYHDEWDAREWLYEHLVAIWAEVELLPSYDELAKWKQIQ